MIITVPIDPKGVRYPSLGGQVCDFIEKYLVFGPGDLRGMPAVLDAEKRALIWRIYEVFPQNHEMAGRRRFKRVGLSLAKGLAKTEYAAWIAACELHPDAPVRCVDWDKEGNPIGGPVTDPYIPMVAYTEEQSDELCYGTLKCILEEGPLRDDFDIGLERITRRRGDGKAVSLSGSPDARDGARTTFSVADETHRWELPRLKAAHQTMMANLPKRKGADPWALEVTTAFEPGANSVAEDTMNYAKAILEGKIKDSRLFFFHRQASEENPLETEEDVRQAVMEASGAAAAWRDIDSIVEQWRDPTTDRAYFERVWTNRLVKASSKAFDSVKWSSLVVENPVHDGDMITLGFDGAPFNDSTGLVATHIPTGYTWPLAVWERPLGSVDWRCPETEVDAAVHEAFTRFKVWRMYCDPPYWQSWIAKWSGEFNKDCKKGEEKVIEWWTNQYRRMAFALVDFDTAIKTDAIKHGGDRALNRHIGNSFKQEINLRDETGKRLWLIHKERGDSPNKIDLAMCAVLSWTARKDAIASGVTGDNTSIYETQEIKVY